jgi:Phosphotransferase enzyme family
VKPGILAATEAGRRWGLPSSDPILLQETNNTVVWLSPHAVVAKVATRADADDKLIREHHVATAVAQLGAPIGRPLKGSLPYAHRDTGFTVTLWERIEQSRQANFSEDELGRSLRRVHEAMDSSGVDLPPFLNWLTEARAALADDQLMEAFPIEDLAVLRNSFDVLLPRLERRSFARQPLHGEPHGGNWIATTSGIRWIDLENACCGPLEWDLAFLPEKARATFGTFDPDLLTLVSVLNSARVATWCGVQGRFPQMLEHGTHHLAEVKKYWLGVEGNGS